MMLKAYVRLDPTVLRTAVVGILMVALSGFVCATTASASDARTYIYGSGATAKGARPLKIDFFAAKNTCSELRPTVLLIHGGGFRIGSRSADALREIAAQLNAQGFNAASMDYRLVRDRPVPSIDVAKLKGARQKVENAANAAIEDTAMAMRWIASNAQSLCADPHKIALLGTSAGSVMALFTTYALDTSPVTRPTPLAVISFWGGYLTPSAFERGDPPLFLIHGTNDRTVPYAHSLALHKAARAKGIPVSFHTVVDGGHGFKSIDPLTDTIDGVPILDEVMAFIAAAAQGNAPPTQTTRTKHRD